MSRLEELIQELCPNGLLEFNVLCREKITMDYPHS